MKRLVIVMFTLIALMIVIMFAGCQFSENQINNTRTDYSIYNNDYIIDNGPVEGGVLKLFCTTPDTLNPIFTKKKYVQRLSNLIFEGMFKIGVHQKAIPVLVEDFSVSEDNLVYTFKIKQGIKWHDGMPLTADDVEYTIKSIIEANEKSIYSDNLSNITTFAATSKYVFKIVLKKPYSFTKELLTFPIIPKHLSNTSVSENKNEEYKPIGTGPYIFDNYEEDSFIRLRVNDNWWNSYNIDKDNLKIPYISQIEFNICKNISDEPALFQSGDIDVAVIDSPDYKQYMSRADIILKQFTGKKFDFIAFNQLNPALNEKAVRQAIAYAVDWNKVVNDVMKDIATRAFVPVMPGSWIFDSSTPPYNCNKEMSEKLLVENGWKKINGKYFKKINGKNEYLEFELLVNDDNEYRIAIAELIAEHLKEIGINIIVKKVMWGDEINLINERAFDIVLIGYRTPLVPDISYLYASSFISPYIKPNLNNGFNLAAYSNESVDKYLEEINTELDDNKRMSLFINMFDIINSDVPYIGLYYYKNAVIYNKNVRGDLYPYAWNIFHDIVRWYIPER